PLVSRGREGAARRPGQGRIVEREPPGPAGVGHLLRDPLPQAGDAAAGRVRRPEALESGTPTGYNPRLVHPYLRTRLAVQMFLAGAVFGAYQPVLPPYFKGLGFSEIQIDLTLAI